MLGGNHRQVLWAMSPCGGNLPEMLPPTAEAPGHKSSTHLPGPAGSVGREVMGDAGQDKNLARGTYQGAGVGGVGRIVLQVAREAEVGHFAHQVAVDQDVSGSQISVHVIHLCKVLHPGGDSSQHSHQLYHCELPIVLLW